MNLLTPDTTPGGDSWAAPPRGVRDYRSWLQEEYRKAIRRHPRTKKPVMNDIDGYTLRQRMVCAANWTRHGYPFEPTGPHADELAEAVHAVAQRIDQGPKRR